MSNNFQNAMWVSCSTNFCQPPNAVEAGTDSDGTVMYVGRAHHAGDVMAAKVLPGKQAAYISYDGQEISKAVFEVLTGHGFMWVPSGNGSIPQHAVPSGITSSGETLYIGRVNHEFSLTVGKVHPMHKCCYIPYGGEEIRHTKYEILVQKPVSSWVPYDVHTPIMADAIKAGHDSDGTVIYVGRASFGGEQLPAKVLPDKHAAYVPYNGGEHLVYQCEVLCNGNLKWIPSCAGTIVSTAVKGGHTIDGETLYIGRALHDNSLTPGKIHPSHQCLYIPYGGREVPLRNYDVLVEE